MSLFIAVYKFKPRSSIKPLSNEDLSSLPVKRRAEAKITNNIITRYKNIH